jgi:hypothetical protein
MFRRLHSTLAMTEWILTIAALAFLPWPLRRLSPHSILSAMTLFVAVLGLTLWAAW